MIEGLLASRDSPLAESLYCRGVEIVKFSTCPGASEKQNCTCP